MIKKQSRKLKRNFRHRRIRKKLSGSAAIPRLSIFKSNKNIYAQVIDDVQKKTILHVSSLSPKIVEMVKKSSGEESGKVFISKLVGTHLAELAKDKKIKKVIFDRGGYPFHGRVKAVADGLKEGGVKI